jgi:hypothetical protein
MNFLENARKFILRSQSGSEVIQKRPRPVFLVSIFLVSIFLISIFLFFERRLRNAFRLDRGLQDARPHALGYFDLERIVPDLADRPDEPADGDDLVAPRDSAYQPVVLFLALALGPDDEKVENEDKYPQRQKHTRYALHASRSPAFSAAAATRRPAGIRYRRRCLFRHTIFLLIIKLLIIKLLVIKLLAVIN